MDPAQGGFGRLSWRLDVEVDLLDGWRAPGYGEGLLDWPWFSLEQGSGEELLGPG